MAKNNQKKEKAARNREYARKFRKRSTGPRRPGRPPMGGSGMSSAPATGAAPAAAAPAASQVAAPASPGPSA
jgi:hypothetical protein